LSNLVVFVDYQSKDCIHGEQVRKLSSVIRAKPKLQTGKVKAIIDTGSFPSSSAADVYARINHGEPFAFAYGLGFFHGFRRRPSFIGV
jgi:hypothetical protein